jgi:hypothetical protein
MKKKDQSFEGKVEVIANYIGINFIHLAKELRELQEAKPDIFLKVAKMAGLSSRKAYALARISRQFDDLGVPEERLQALGWTKLQIIGRYLSGDNAESLLQLAEQNTVHELESRLRGEPPVEDARVMVFYFSPQDYERLKAKLVKHGAIVSGKGLLKKEAALMALVDKK